MLLDDVIGRRLFKALLPRISVLFDRIAGLPAVNIESPGAGKKREKTRFRLKIESGVSRVKKVSALRASKLNLAEEA